MKDKKRDHSIDTLRATAILLMTITHVNAVFYTGSNIILQTFTTIGATVCFSIFLFCFAYIIGTKLKKGKKFKTEKILKKIFPIYIVYIILAILIDLILNKSLSFTSVLNIITFNYQPEYTEFLLAFILFPILALIFQKPLRYLQTKPLITIGIGIFALFIGNYLHSILSLYTYPDIIRIIIENTFGYQDLHRFPIFQYLIIFLLAIILSANNKYILKTALISTALLIITKMFNLSGWYRWPPSPEFLLYGIIYITGLLYLLKKFKFPSITIGKYPLEQLFLSTALIFILRCFVTPSAFVLQTIFLNAIVLIILFLHPIVFHRKMV